MRVIAITPVISGMHPNVKNTLKRFSDRKEIVISPFLLYYSKSLFFNWYLNLLILPYYILKIAKKPPIEINSNKQLITGIDQED